MFAQIQKSSNVLTPELISQLYVTQRFAEIVKILNSRIFCNYQHTVGCHIRTTTKCLQITYCIQ